MGSGAKAGSNADSYLTFDLSGVPPFAQAKLRLYASLQTKSSMSAGVYAVPLTTWAEQSITWHNKPALGALLNTLTVPAKPSALVDLDLTA